MSIYVNQPLARGETSADRHLYLRTPELDQGAIWILAVAQQLKTHACAALCQENPVNIRLTGHTAHIILLLAMGKPMRISEIEKTSGIPRPSLARHLRQLESADLIERTICRRDARQKLVALTDTGKQLGLKAAGVWRKMLTEAYLAAGPEGVQGARAVLEGLMDHQKRRSV